jgi:hypothetical protein
MVFPPVYPWVPWVSAVRLGPLLPPSHLDGLWVWTLFRAPPLEPGAGVGIVGVGTVGGPAAQQELEQEREQEAPCRPRPLAPTAQIRLCLGLGLRGSQVWLDTLVGMTGVGAMGQ